MNLQFNKCLLFAVLSAFNVIFCPASLGINLILPKNDNFLKVGAKDGYILTFGNYFQDSVDPNAEVKSFKYRQPIAWRILDSENLDPQSNLAPTKAGETQTPEEAAAYGDAKGLTILSQKVLDNTRQFHASSCDWRVSDVRKFLNDEYTNLNGRRMSFYQNATVFTMIERSVIATTNVTTLDMAGKVEPGTNTHFTSQDHVFLLSVDEMAGDINKASGIQTAATAYGFNENYQWSSQQQKYTRAYVTDFASSEGVQRLNDVTTPAAFRDDGGGFWLRTPGVSSDSAKATASAADGHLTTEGFSLNYNNIGVRPALLTNKAPVIFLQDVATLPWSLLPAALGSDPGYQNHRLWQEVANFINPLVINYLFGDSLRGTAANNAARMYETVMYGASSGLASFIGANSKRIEQTDTSDAYYDGGIYRHFKFILKTSELGEVTYTINAITLEGVQLEAATTQAENAYFDAAAITNVASDTPRSGDYTYSYPYTSYVIRLAKVANQDNYNLSTEFKHGAHEEQFTVDRLIFFQHQATALDEKLNALYHSNDTIKKMNQEVKAGFD